MRAANPDRDRWLALAILGGLLLLAYLVLVHPWWAVPMMEVEGRIDDLQQRDLRARMELRQAPEVDKRLQAVRAAAERVPGFMPQRSPELATSALVQRLETAVLEASRSEEHTSELQSLMRISYAVFCLKKKKQKNDNAKQLHNKN